MTLPLQVVLKHNSGASAEVSSQLVVRRNHPVLGAIIGRCGRPFLYLAPFCLGQVYLHGAVVASWKQASGDEVLYVRPDAVFDKSKPISGGIPHCFPQVRGVEFEIDLGCCPETSCALLTPVCLPAAGQHTTES